MQAARKTAWSRITAESLVIVSSILLAFAIDAWWEDRSEKQAELSLLADLRTDFQASQAHLETWLEGTRRQLKTLTHLRDQLQAAPRDESIEVDFYRIVAAIGAPTYDPTDASLQAASASGRIELLRDPDLRKALAAWRQLIDDTQEDEHLIRNLVVQQIVPILAEQIRLGEPFGFETITGWFRNDIRTDPDRQFSLHVTPELEGVIAERVFYETFVAEGLASIYEAQDRILAIIDRNL